MYDNILLASLWEAGFLCGIRYGYMAHFQCCCSREGTGNKPGAQFVSLCLTSCVNMQ